MTKKLYRTAQGKTIDLGAIQLQNEQTRAVGNMKVNARGDLIDSLDRPIDSRTQQVEKQYRKQVSNVKDQPAQKSGPVTRKSQASVRPSTSVGEKSESVPVPQSDPTEDNATSGGLAAAIARARQIKQEPIRTAQQIAQNLNDD